MLANVYPIISMVLWSAALLFSAVLAVRMLISYVDPNPFGTVGRLGFRIRKLTERWVYPAAGVLARFGVNVKLAPLITIFFTLVITYFATAIIADAFFVIDGISVSIAAGRPQAVAGFVLFGLISIAIFLIIIRFLSSWFVFAPNTFLGFVSRVTDPILLPIRRIIPPVGMFDLSGMVLLLLLSVLRGLVLRAFV